MQTTRRGFLQQTAVLSSAAAAPSAALPTMRLGKYSVSRLICGSNMFAGGSHLSGFLNRRLKDYYTDDQIVKTLSRCAAVGINCFQAVPNFIPVYRRVVDAGASMHFLSLHYGPDKKPLQELTKAGCIGVAHHGEFTDRLFKSGRIEEIQSFLQNVKDAGLLAGVSTHMPAVVDTIESKSWPVDFYMTCVYERHRTEEDLRKLLGHVPLPVGEVYLQDDPARMFGMIQQTRKPCLAFKILAAGRRTDLPAAFRETFAAIKRGDGVIVGMYDEYSDQPAENAELVRRYGGGGLAG